MAQRQVRPPRLSGQALQAAAQEADAVATAMEIAGIPRTELNDLGPDGEIPFLDRLAAVRVPEDAAINFDVGRFLDFEQLEA